MRRILIVDDDISVTNYLMVFLMQHEVFEPVVLNDSREVPGVLESSSFDTIILDMDMPNLSGLDLLKIIKKNKIETPVLILSGVNDVDLAVKALKLGAFDYLMKPVDDEYLLKVIDRAIEHRTLHDSISQLPPQLTRADLTHGEAFAQLVTQNPDVIHIFHEVEQIAAGDVSIFLMGERGTGKRTLAQASHNASPRSHGPFVDVNVADHDADSFAAEFFGLAKGWAGAAEEQEGFLERAHGGTLYVSNIEMLSLPAQHRLDRVIRTGEFYRQGTTEIRTVDIRLIVSSTVDLTQDSYRERFSGDLLYHLWGNLIKIPALRDREGDLPLFVDHFFKQQVERTGKPIQGVDPALIEFLKGYDFPGNESELRDIIATAILRESGDTLGIESLSHYVRDKIQNGVPARQAFIFRKLEDVIRDFVRATVGQLDGDIHRAALELDILVDEVRKYCD